MSPKLPGRHYAYAEVTEAEYAVMKALAKKEGLSIANFVRRCVNGYLLELGDDVPLLGESDPRARKPRAPSLRGRGRARNEDRWA